MPLPKLRPRAEVRIKPGVYPQVAVEAAYIDERLQNLGASQRDRRVVTQGLASGVISRVSAFSVSTNDGHTRDEVQIDVKHENRRRGRHMDMDLSGRQSVTEQIGRADAAALKNEIKRFGRRGRRTEIELGYAPHINNDPAAYQEVSRALGTQPVTRERKWRGGGSQERFRITPGRFEDTITVTDRTWRRPR
jgi:hypothetical protein